MALILVSYSLNSLKVVIVGFSEREYSKGH